MSKITLNNISLAYDVINPNHEQTLSPIILLHGMTSSRFTWKDIPNVLCNATGRVVYILDARNHGESQFTDNFSYELMAEDILNFMDNLNISKAVLIGHSMGGKTAMLVALKKPEQVEKLIIEDMTPLSLGLRQKLPVIQYIQLLKLSLLSIPSDITDLESAKKHVLQYIHNALPMEHRPKSKGLLEASTLPLKKCENGKFEWQCNLLVLEKLLLNNAEVNFNVELSGLYQGPALFIYGTKSLINIANDKEGILKLFPNTTFEPIEGGHSLHSEHPELFKESILKFLNNS